MAYWIGGTLTALLGVGLVRLLGPALTGFAGSLANVVGYLLVIVGITIVARATRRERSHPSQEMGTDTPTAGS